MITLQFRVLYRVFLLRVVDLELLSGDGDTTKLLGQFAAMFAGVSILFTAPLITVGSRLPQTDLWSMEHLLIATTMAVVGLFSVLSWDALVPDRRDVLVLAPLPIRTGVLFSAKLAAVAVSLGLVIVSLNVLSGLIWPLLFEPAGAGTLGAIRSLGAYWITMIMAGAFTFCSVLAIQGLAAHLLSRQHYLRASAVLQVAGFSLFVGLYFLEPSLETTRALTAVNNQRLLAFLPSYWYLAVFQQLNGSMSPEFSPLANRAWVGSLLAVCAAAIVLLLSYFRTLRKLVEEPDILPATRRLAWWSSGEASVQTAVLFFSIRTLLRSRQHRLITSFYLGVGGAAVLAYIRFSLGNRDVLEGLKSGQMRVSVLSGSILLMCVIVAGVRAVFVFPTSLSANWIFRMTELMDVAEYVRAARRTLLVMSVAPIWLVVATGLVFIWPLGLAVEHLVALGLFGGLIAELSLINFHKIPFTCTYLPGKANVHCLFWVSVMLLIPVAIKTAGFERRVLNNGPETIIMILFLAIALASARLRTHHLAVGAAELKFEDNPAPEVFALQLDRS